MLYSGAADVPTSSSPPRWVRVLDLLCVLLLLLALLVAVLAALWLRLGVPATARASFWVYSEVADVDALADGLLAARRLFGG